MKLMAVGLPVIGVATRAPLAALPVHRVLPFAPTARIFSNDVGDSRCSRQRIKQLRGIFLPNGLVLRTDWTSHKIRDQPD